ncbi:Zinc finger CCCH domain-containing protein 59 [Grifola frondosa]|uniref:Zinc finger CCCH domain-containing protein 59 n=1 Tax=Grifola frondosa TaxID=5627 RepID=A0A1C7LWK2_GRIFR|nr:Zinc finger CCCH domain-containing protein 59 [Grifola frondosa]
MVDQIANHNEYKRKTSLRYHRVCSLRQPFVKRGSENFQQQPPESSQGSRESAHRLISQSRWNDESHFLIPPEDERRRRVSRRVKNSKNKEKAEKVKASSGTWLVGFSPGGANLILPRHNRADRSGTLTTRNHSSIHSMSSTVKILTVGSAVGSIRELFVKIKAIDAKHGKFDLVLCTGDFFGPPKDESEVVGNDDEVVQLLDGRLEAPVECYVMQGEHSLPAPVIEKFAKTGGALSKNVFLLHKSGVMTTAHGLRIACLGGIYDSNLYASAESAHGFTSPYFTSQTVEKLLANTMTKSKPKEQNYTSLASIKTTVTDSQDIDILISNAWPSSITQLSSAPLPSPELAYIGVDPVAEIVRRTRPRYHFAAGGGQPPVFWEREPFVWDEANGRITRFVSLGAFGGEPTAGKKQRWFYAFSISPNTETTAPPPRPANSTKNPFTEMQRAPKRPLESDAGQDYRWGDIQQPKRSRTDGPPGKPPAGYKCKICESPEHFIVDCPDREKPKEGYICKICNESGHFVRDCPVKNAVGDTGGRKPREGIAPSRVRVAAEDTGIEAHVDLQRRLGRTNAGSVSQIPTLRMIHTETFDSVDWNRMLRDSAEGTNNPDTHGRGAPGRAFCSRRGHVLIVPITHYPTYSSIPPDLSGPIVEETDRYKSALRAMYAKHDAAAVSFEVGRLSAKGGHAHVQVVPIPLKLRDLVENAFLREGRSQGIEFEEDPESALEACSGGRGSYFRVDLPDGRKMVHLMRDSVPFSVQFGRQVLVSLLGMEGRFDWKACLQSDEEDTADAQAFKAAFLPFDPSL